MLKRLAFLLLLIIVLPSYGSKEAAHAEGNKNASQDSLPAALVKVAQTTPANKGDGSEDAPESFIAGHTPPEKVTDFGLLVVGVLGIIAATCTLIKLSQQTEATKGAVEAALLQARHTETTERAWLIVNFVSMKDKELKDGEVADCRWAIKNVGGTPAILLETKTRFHVFRLYDGMPEDPVKQLPTVPDYGIPITINERLVAPQDSMGYFTKWERYIDGRFSEFVFPAKTNEIWMVVAYGYVKYRDIFGKERESRSCDFALVGRNDQFIVEFRPHPKAPPAYNRCS